VIYWLAVVGCLTGHAFGWNGDTPQARPLRNAALAISGLDAPYAELISTDVRGRYTVCLPSGRYAISLPWDRSPRYEAWPSSLDVPSSTAIDLYFVR